MNERPTRHAKVVAYPTLKNAELGARMTADATRTVNITFTIGTTVVKYP
jgi:hypothetical protein